jgi:hypothetical protein
MSRARILQTAVAAILAATLALPSTALASGGGVSRRGSCSGRSDWRLDVQKEDGGRLRVRYRIDGGASGQDWHIFMSDNGTGIFSGTRTSSSGGYLEVRTHTINRVGPDAIKAAGNNLVTGETCGGKATF